MRRQENLKIFPPGKIFAISSCTIVADIKIAMDPVLGPTYSSDVKIEFSEE